MNVKERRALEAAISDLIDAKVDLSWIGSMEPEDHASVRAAVKASKRRLRDLLNAQMDIAPDARDAV